VSGGVVGGVGHASLQKGPPPLAALVAAAAVTPCLAACLRPQAGEGGRQGLPARPPHEIGLAEPTKRRDQFHFASDRQRESLGKLPAKRFGGVVEGIARKGAHGEPADAVQPAPDQRFDRQERIAAGKIDRVVGRRVIGRASAIKAPVMAIEVGGRHVQLNEFTEPAKPRQPTHPRERASFGGLPERPAADVDRHDRPLAEGLFEQDRAVEPSAGKDRKLLTVGQAAADFECFRQRGHGVLRGSPGVQNGLTSVARSRHDLCD